MEAGMRKRILGVLVGAGCLLLASGGPPVTEAQTAQAGAPRSTMLVAPSSTLEDALLEWPLPPGGQAYATIDGRHLHGYVDQQVAISRRYRDQGHPKFWGRIIGTSSDAE